MDAALPEKTFLAGQLTRLGLVVILGPGDPRTADRCPSPRPGCTPDDTFFGIFLATLEAPVMEQKYERNGGLEAAEVQARCTESDSVGKSEGASGVEVPVMAFLPCADRSNTRMSL